MNKLSDFPLEVLEVMQDACIERCNDLKAKRRAINQLGQDTRKMMIEILRQIHKDLEHLETAKVQLAMSINEAKDREKILMN